MAGDEAHGRVADVEAHADGPLVAETKGRPLRAFPECSGDRFSRRDDALLDVADHGLEGRPHEHEQGDAYHVRLGDQLPFNTEIIEQTKAKGA